MKEYNLSIYCVDGSTYGLISVDKKQLWKFLKEHDHEGAQLSLIKKEGAAFTEVDYDGIYLELQC